MGRFGAVLVALALVSACGGSGSERGDGAVDGAVDAGRAAAEAPAEAAAADMPAPDEVTGEMGVPRLAGWFDCLRENGGVTIAAHRGGPLPGYPENALETLQYNFDQGIDMFEIDVAESQDGVLFLLHDRSLGRTTTGDGQVVETDWDDIRGLRLVDNEGEVTDFAPPRLTDVLLWAKETGAIVELDRKRSTSFRNIISAVRAAGAEQNVILISYNEDQAALISELAPDVILTASADSRADLNRLEGMGVNLDHLVAWTGTRQPDARAWAELRAAGVEPGFGTLGRPGERLDDAYAADGDLSEFVALGDDGLVLLSTDIPLAVAEALEADDAGKAACPLR